jgi:hypothetical protein
MHPDEYFPQYAKYEQLNTNKIHYKKSFIKMFDIFDEGLKTTDNAKMAYEYVEFKLLSNEKSKYS